MHAWRLPTGRTSSHQPFRTNPENGCNAANYPFSACTYRQGELISRLSLFLFHKLEALHVVTEKRWGTSAGTTVLDKWESWPHAYAACVPWTCASPIWYVQPLYSELLPGPHNLGPLWIWQYPVCDESCSFWLHGHLVSCGWTLHCHQSPAASQALLCKWCTFPCFRWGTVLDFRWCICFQGLLKQSTVNWGLEIAKCTLTVWEARKPKPSCQYRWFLLEALREKPFLCVSRFLVVASILWYS